MRTFEQSRLGLKIIGFATFQFFLGKWILKVDARQDRYENVNQIKINSQTSLRDLSIKLHPK